MKAINRIFVSLMVASSLLSCSKDNGGEEPSPTPTEAKLTIMSFNLRSSTMKDEGDKSWSSRKTAIQKMVNDKRPAVIGMQEALNDMRKDLKSLLPGYAMLEVPGTGTSKGGNTVLMYDTSAVKMNDYKSFYLSPTPDVPSVNSWNSETQYRTTIWGKFTDRKSSLVFYVADTHMPLYNTPDGVTARNNSAQLNVDRLKSAAGDDATLFIVGDMNCSSSAAGLKNYETWLYAARASYSEQPFSYNAFGGSSQSNLDHIYYRNVSKVTFSTINANYGVPYISDHYPILAEATVKPKAE